MSIIVPNFAVLALAKEDNTVRLVVIRSTSSSAFLHIVRKTVVDLQMCSITFHLDTTLPDLLEQSHIPEWRHLKLLREA